MCAEGLSKYARARLRDPIGVAERDAAKSLRYRLAHPERIKAVNATKYRKYPHLYKINAKIKDKRHRAHKPACVSWSEIRDVYRNCPDHLTVDHIIPLIAKIGNVQVACGLHAPWNLQYLTSADNDRKGCRGWEQEYESA